MSDTTTSTTDPIVPVRTIPVSATPDVSQQVNLQFKIRDLWEKYTAKFKNDPDYDRKKSSFGVMVRGVYSELDQRGVPYGDGQDITHEWVFDKAKELWENPEPTPTPEPAPPAPKKTATNIESASTVVTGHETFTPEDFPLHDNETWLRVRRKYRNMTKTLKTSGDTRNVVSDILGSLTES